MYILFSRVKLITMYFPVIIIDDIVTCGQCRLNAWARWAIAHGPHEHMGPMLIYACCVRHVFNISKHWLCWKYQYNKYIFNFIDHLEFYSWVVV